MTRVQDIANFFARLVPNELKMEFDNVGLLVGINKAPVTKVLIALDITDAVIGEAVAEKAELILSHHPLFFELNRVNDADGNGAKIVRLLRNGISALCLHTNLDAVSGGVNDALAERLGVPAEGWLEAQTVTADGREAGMGRFGHLPSPLTLSDFLTRVKTKLDAPGLRYADGGKPVHKVALCGGSGGSLLERAAALGCDTLVTADVKHDRFLTARELGLTLIDAGHFSTENVVVPVLAMLLREGFPEILPVISKASVPPAHFF